MHDQRLRKHLNAGAGISENGLFGQALITKKSETIFETDLPVFAEYSLADSIKRSSSLNVNFVFITEPQYFVSTDSFVNIIRQKEKGVNIRDDHTVHSAHYLIG